jgi:hypothetical protein
VGQALIGVGVLVMLAANLVGFMHVLFYVAFYLGMAMVPAGAILLVMRNRRPA